MTEAQQYQAKFQEMQKHIPFIQKVIEKLKVSNSQQGDNPRKAQLQKMEMLHELLTNPAKKLKMETLMKCEGVLVKLQAKIEKQSTFLQNEDPILKPTETAKPKVTAGSTTTSASSAAQTSKTKPNVKTVATATAIIPTAKAIASAPASPSPERVVDEDDVIQPVVIPTERRDSPIEMLDKQKTSSSLFGSKLKDPKQRLHQQDHQRYRSPPQHHQQPHHHHSRDSPKLEEHRSRLQDVRERTSKHIEGSDTSRPGYSTPPALHYYRQPTDAGTSCPSKEFPPLPPPLRINIYNPMSKAQPLAHKKETKASSPSLSSKSTSPQMLQTVKVVITEPLPANIAKQHFPPHHQYRYQQTQQQLSSPTRFLHNVEILPQSNIPSTAEKSPSSDEAYNPDECWEKYNEAQKKSKNVQQSAKPIFSRLGDKVMNDEPKKSSAPVNIPARSSTPIPEVLKSPPLSVNDIKNLLIESGGEQITPDISEIGTRRTKKPDMSDCKNSLDFVRRKFAQIAKINTSQIGETNCSSSPSSPAVKAEENNITTTPTSTNKAAVTNERLALKYNPHPRQERLQSLSSNDGSECSLQSLTRVGASPNDPRLKLKMQTTPVVIAPLASNVNVLPSINNSDPRLKRQAAAQATAMNSNAIPVLCHAIPQLPPASLNPFGIRNDPRLSRQQSFQQSNTSNPYLQQSPIRNLNISQPPVTPEENWDSDSTIAPIEQSPIRNKNVSQPNITPEENWDSDPDDGPAKTATSFGSSKELQRPPAGIPPATNRESICQPRDNHLVANDFHTDVPVVPKVLHAAANVRDKCWESRPEVVASMLREPVKAQIPGSLFVPFVVHSKPQPSSSYPINPYVKRPAALLTTPAIPPLTVKTSHDALPVQSPFMPAVVAQPPASRFNSSLNDNTERMKYFEARQQKSQQPRTYKEFREAREEANRRAMNAKYKAERKKGYIDAAKRKFQEDIAKKEQEQEKAKSKIEDHLHKLEEKRTGVIKEKEADKDTTTAAAKAVAGESTLDKMYRTQNFNTQFPKATISFKIPKKKTEESKPKNLPPKVEGKGTKQAPQKPIDRATKSNNVKESDKSQDKTDKNEKCKKPTTNVDKSAGQGKADKSRAVTSNTKSSEENNKKDTKEEDVEEMPQAVIKTVTDKSQVNRRDPRCKNKDINEENERQNLKTSKEEENKTVKTSKEHFKGQKTDTKSIDNLKVFDKKSFTVDDIKPFEVKSGLTAASPSTPEFKPQRILRRRCTMVAIGSAPLVDKDKLMKANALMLEDIEERDKLRRKKEEEERQNARRNKHLAEIFQKTDDNCSVSTQNIITGKRRTRASINFNETQNALKIFKHKTMPATAAAASPSSTATGKVTRARAKSNKASSEDSAAEKEDNEDDDVTEEETNEKLHSDTEESGSKSNTDKKKDDNEKDNTDAKDYPTPDKATDDEAKYKIEETTNNKPPLKKGLKKATGGAIVKIVVATNKQGQGTNKKANTTAAESGATPAKAKAKLNDTSSKTLKLTTQEGPASTGATAIEIEAVANTTKDQSLPSKPLEDEHQNCAVSSTSTDLTPSEDTPCTSSAAAQRLKEEVNDNEPSSTGSKSSNATPTLPEDETSRHAFLNEFVQEIIKPNADKQHILSLLGQILSEDKLQFIKTVIDSTNKQEEEDKKAVADKAQAAKDDDKQQIPVTNTNVNKKKPLKKTVKVEEESADEGDEDSGDDQKSSSSSLKKRNKGGRKNELQRLNEDIRDMFICEGVLTATGKRMCTLMQTSDKQECETETSKEPGRKSLQSSTSPQNKADVETADSKDSAKKRLLGRNKTPKALPVRRSLRACKNAENLKTNSINEDEGEAANSNESKEDPDDHKESTKNDATPTRKMPVLKPHTPIKLPEELDIQGEASTDTEKPASSSVKRKSTNKPCPKSKKVKTVAKNVDDDLYTSSDSQTDSDGDNADDTAKSNELDTMKNTNVHWHNQSKYTTWCMLCSKKIPAVSSSFHYKMHHGENFISRLAPILLQKFKQGKLSHPLFGVDRSPRQASWFYRCPFCLQYFNTPMPLWMEHFQNHTAEFRYECSKCHWGSNRLATTRRHISNIGCKGATVVNSVVKLVVPSEIKAQVCHLCNFVQLKRANLERHYVEQHQLAIKNVDILGYTVTLFNCAGVELVSEAKAQAKEDEQRKLIEAEEKIIELEDEMDEEEEGSTQLDETKNEQESSKLDNTKKVKDKESLRENNVEDSTEAVKEKPNGLDDQKAKGIESSVSAETTLERQETLTATDNEGDSNKTQPSIAATDKDINQMDTVGVIGDTDMNSKPDKAAEKSLEVNKKTAKTSIVKQKPAENQLSSAQPSKGTIVTSKPDKSLDANKKIAKTTTDTLKSTEGQLSSSGSLEDTDVTFSLDKATEKSLEANKKISQTTTEKQTDEQHEKGNKSENKTSEDIVKNKDGKQTPPQSTSTKKDGSCDEKLTENVLSPLKKCLKEEAKDGKQATPQSTSTKKSDSAGAKPTEDVSTQCKKSLKEETTQSATVKVTESVNEEKSSSPRNTSAPKPAEVQLQTGKGVKDQKGLNEKDQTTNEKLTQPLKDVETTPTQKSPVAAVKQPKEILLQPEDNKPQDEKLKQPQQQVKTTAAGKASSEQYIKDATNNESPKEDNKPEDEKLKQPQQQVKATIAKKVTSTKEDNKPEDEKLKQPQQQVKATIAKKVTSTAVQKISQEDKTDTTTPEEKLPSKEDKQTAGQVEQTFNAAKAKAARKENCPTEIHFTPLEALASSQEDDQTEIQLTPLQAEEKTTVPEKTIDKKVKRSETELTDTTKVKETKVLQHQVDEKTISSAIEKLPSETTSTMTVKLTKPGVLAKSSSPPQHKQATEEINCAALEKTTSTPKKIPSGEITKQPSHELLPTERPATKTTPKKKPSNEELNKSEKILISSLKTGDNSKQTAECGTPKQKTTIEDVKSPQYTAEAVKASTTKKSAEESDEVAAIATPTKKPRRQPESTKLENTPNRTPSKLQTLGSNGDQKLLNTTPKKPTPSKETKNSDVGDEKTSAISTLLTPPQNLEKQLSETPQKQNIEATTSESDMEKESTPLKFNAQKVVSTYARKKGNETSPSALNPMPTADDCVIIDEDINIRYLQDELLTLAAQAANEEEENEKQLKALDVLPDSPKTIQNFTSIPDSSPHANTKMSDLISNSIDMLYQRNKRKSYDAADATDESTMHTKRACYREPAKTTLTANAFIPSVLEGCESPPVQILAQSIVSIDTVEHNVDGGEIQKPQTSSIAERLSQRFKLLQEKAAKGLKDTCNATKAIASESADARYSELVKLTVGMEEGAAADVAIPNETKEFHKPVIHEEITVISDDEDWEDIEITESAPITVPSNNLQKTNKNKGLFQKFGLFKGNSAKTKKNPPPLVFLPKKKIKEKMTTTATSSPVTTKAMTANNFAGDKTNSASTAAVHLGFKPVINIIEDLLPDSPCNDPIDLVPELTPLEPLTDLNDISSILDSNLSINIDESQTCIQDALDFISEQQAHDHHGVQNSQVKTKSHTNKIQHVGFSLQSPATNSVKFYCLLENCSFLFSSDSTGLENHFLCEHSQIKWNGYCAKCEAQCLTNDQEYSIVKEIKHMIECHVSKTSTELETHSNESSQHSVNTNPPAEDRPRIKLRRMTGDCLSTSNSESSTPSGSTTAATTVAATLVSPITAAAAQSNTLLGALLNSKQKPPTKEMPPQPAMPLTEPLLIDAAAKFSNMDNDFLITAVASGVQPSATAAPLLISNVVSLNEKVGERTISALPKISNVCTLNSRSVGNLWAQQIEQEKQDLLESAAESMEVSSILANAGHPSLRREGTRAQDDSPGPVIVSETLPVAQAKTGDFVITQTVSAQYDTYASAAVGFNISIEVPPVSSNLVHNADLAGSTTTPASVQSRNNSPLTSLPLVRSQSFTGNPAAHDEDSRNSIGFLSTSLSDSPVNAGGTTSHVTSRQYKCMASGCKFTSRVPVAMSDHLRFHERRSFSNNQDYLACAFCNYQADDVDDYMKHSDKYHIITKTNKPPTTTTELEAVAALTSVRGRICDILSKKMESSANRNIALAQQQEAQKAEAAVPKETEEMYLKKLGETIEEIVGTTGFSDEKLYRCVIKNCTTPLTESTFHNHVMYHISTLGISNPNSYVYKCPHCTAQYHRPAGIKAHIKNHARNRYFCYMCDATSANPSQMMKHFSDNHWHTLNMYTKELFKAKDSSYYVTYSSELNDGEVHKYGEKLILEWQRKKSGSKTHFKSSEIDLLPIQPIFQRPVNCGECEYKTKVRTNMYRHLLMHKQFAQQPNNTLVASVDPVNPVPCLNSNERFFDKMTNLASSSLIPSSTAANASAAKSAFKLPHAFVPGEQRFRCGVPDCDFVNTSEVVFRVHMSTLHSSHAVFRCPFCQEEICKRAITIDRILNHLRLHGSILHRCEECNYVHHLRFVVERHINENHPTMKVNIVKHKRTDVVGEGTTSVTSFAGKKYKDTPKSNQSQATSNSSTNTQAGPKSSNSADSTTKSAQSASSNAKSKGKWQCDLCNHKVSSLAQIQQHCQNAHGQSQPYQCVHCSFGSQQLSQILYHIDEIHAGKTREARYIYHKSFTSNEDDVADTRPLWQRNDPTRVRHIRGILMEDEEESEKYRKKMGLDKVVDDEEEEQVDGNNAHNENVSNLAMFLKGYEFGCFHCDHKTETLDELFAGHYKNDHCGSLDIEKPFMFRLLRRVCCPECRKFTGNFYELQLHLLNFHNVRNFYAADVSAAENGGDSQRLTCGYCDFHCLKTELLQKHFLSPKVQHSPLDVCIQNSEQIADILQIGTNQTFFQCTLCTELLSSRVSMVQHAKQLHAQEEGFSFRELTNTLIYHCALCSYSSTDESVLLRHMIDHFGRFKRCHFCHETQVSFEGYMQHCYAEHRDDIRRFRELYPYREIQKFLLQMFILFPNGLVISKKNLLCTQTYGGEKVMTACYEEIYKISQQPPIPRLSIARLVARKSIEACHKPAADGSNEEAKFGNQPSPQPSTSAQAKKITKRRCTVALGQDDETGLSINSSADNVNINTSAQKKRKPSLVVVDHDSSSNQSSEFNVPLAHAMRIKKRRRTVATDPNEKSQPPHSPVNTTQPPVFRDEANKKSKRPKTATDSATTVDRQEDSPLDVEFFSYYGIKPEPLDLSKIYTKVAIGGINTPLPIDKFRLFFNIDCKLKLTKCDVTNMPSYKQYKHIKKACPASHKLRFSSN